MSSGARERMTESMKYFVKSKLRPYLKGYIRELVDRARGVTKIPLTHEAIAELVGKPDPTILEIGSNTGSDTLAFLRLMPEAKIYCFEPDPRAIACFKRNLGPYLDKVKLFEVAVSDRAGQIDFHTSSGGPEGFDDPEGWNMSGSIRRPKNHLTEYSWVKFDKVIPVSTCRLDDWCEENGVEHVDFIWMDVQGAEQDVIAGAPTILQKTRFLYTEYSNNELYEGQLSLKRLLALLPSFEVEARYPGDVLLRNRRMK
jgi:2-O-methyltransferase